MKTKSLSLLESAGLESPAGAHHGVAVHPVIGWLETYGRGVHRIPGRPVSRDARAVVVAFVLGGVGVVLSLVSRQIWPLLILTYPVLGISVVGMLGKSLVEALEPPPATAGALLWLDSLVLAGVAGMTAVGALSRVLVDGGADVGRALGGIALCLVLAWGHMPRPAPGPDPVHSRHGHRSLGPG